VSSYSAAIYQKKNRNKYMHMHPSMQQQILNASPITERQIPHAWRLFPPADFVKIFIPA
jgi:hypothetical protein